MIAIRIHGRRIPAATYIEGMKLAKAHPDKVFKTTLWGMWFGTGAEIMRQYRADLHKRINERAGAVQIGGRVHPHTWAMARRSRAVLERHDVRSLNRHAKRRLASRQRED